MDNRNPQPTVPSPSESLSAPHRHDPDRVVIRATGPDLSSRAKLLEAICRREELQAELDKAALEVSAALLDLKWQGATARDLAELLGISRQRVYQLLDRAEKDLQAQELDRKAASWGMASAGPDNYGVSSGSWPCFNRRCRKFKPRPSSVCGQCGDDPVTYNGDRMEFDRAHGYA